VNTTKTGSFTATADEHAAALDPARAGGVRYHVALGYLRAFITVLVVAHHAVLAYHPYAPVLDYATGIWQVFPIVDPQRAPGVDLFVGFNETFFMSLMFLLSGLFVWQSLQRKGSLGYVRDRVLRLGLPFAVAALVLAPLAYYPSYLVSTSTPSLADFWQQWLARGNWPAGPAWFLWLLLAFDLVAAALFMLVPGWGSLLGRMLSGAMRRPIVFFGLLVALSAATYLPMALTFTPEHWSAFGPFAFQTGRLLHYFVYFLMGVGIGAAGIEHGLLKPDGSLARRWFLWLGAALVVFVLSFVVIVASILTGQGATPLWGTLAGLAFVISCATTGLAFLALFTRFARARVPVLESLRDSAYGIFLVHYAVVSWFQYALLGWTISGWGKVFIVAFGALFLSWGLTVLLRRVPAVAKVI
jgi:peptidoglycan/LPS O-acetylase OafA/YrhL